jgi:TRAP-type mannitol/chloroaromatic compound transport system substrate-binding protein
MRKHDLHRPLAAAALAGLIGFAWTGTADAQDRVRWQVPIAFASTLTALGDTLPWVAEQVGKMSDGNIQFIVAEPGKVVPALGIFDAVSEGKLEAGYSWMGYEQGKIAASALFGARPFGLEPDEYAAWIYFGGGDELVKEVYAPHNIYPIFCGTISPEAAGWFKFKIENLDQVKGLKFRAAGLGGKVMEKVGASVTVLPGGELYQALERGVLDGTEFSLPTVDEQLGFYQVAKFYHLPGWHQPSTSQYLYVNVNAWDGLSDAQKAIIETACEAGVTHAIAKAEALQGPVLTKFREEHGVTAATLPDDVLQALQKASFEVMAEESAANEDFKRVYESQLAFQKQHQPWKELGYLPRDWPVEPTN